MQPMPATTIEDLEFCDAPIDAAAVLSDEQLVQGGLVPIQGYMRTRPAANAVRQTRKRQRQRAEGLTQLNVVVPDEAKPALKTMAAALTAGDLDPQMIANVSAILAGGGWRARLVRWLVR